MGIEMSAEELRNYRQTGRTPHKHAELIKAWADGATIQWRNTYNPDWADITYPSWNTENWVEYRIKPKTIKYRLYLNRYGRVTAWGNTTQDPTYSFIKWLGDWQEVEV